MKNPLRFLFPQTKKNLRANNDRQKAIIRRLMDEKQDLLRKLDRP